MKTSLLLSLFILSQIFDFGVCANFPPNNYALSFPTVDHIAAAILQEVPLPKETKELTLSLWINQYSRYEATFSEYISYALPIKGGDNTILFESAGNTWGLYIKNVHITFDYPVKLHEWFHSAITWESEKGAVSFYIDGKLAHFQVYHQLKEITWDKDDGTLVLGQDQDTMGGGFNKTESYRGEMSEVNIWDRALGDVEVKKVFHSELEGNIVAWSETAWTFVNNISVIASSVHGLCDERESKEYRMLKEDTLINSTMFTEQPLSMR